MRITTQGDYALRCILAIADNGAKKPVSISSIVKQEGLPLDYTEQLLMKLRRRRLVKSVRGAKGGYLLNRSPSGITLKDVLEAVEGEAFKVICDHKNSRRNKRCGGECVLKNVWLDLKRKIDGYLQGRTIASLMK